VLVSRTKFHSVTSVVFLNFIADGNFNYPLSVAQQPLVGQSLLFNEASRSHSIRQTTLAMIPLDEWSARRRDINLTTQNTRKRQTSMLPGGIRTHNPSKQAVTYPRFRPHGPGDRHM